MLSVIDIFAGLICLLILHQVMERSFRGEHPAALRHFRMAFRLRMFFSLAFSLIAAYYYRGGDTEMFLYGARDMRQAIREGGLSVFDILFMNNSNDSDLLSYYFEIDESIYPVSGFMKHSGNFMVPKVGLIPFLLTDSYLVLCFVFSFFALMGGIRLYRLFLIYFPGMRKEIAIATLLLPSVGYWSSGFMKDSLCFGALGFLLYGIYQLVIARRKMVESVIWIIVSFYLIYTIKVYILLALIPGIAFWLFGATGSRIRNKFTRRAVVFFLLIAAAGATFYFLNIMTTDESLEKFSVDNLLESSEYSREIFERRGDQGSNFQFNTTNPALLLVNGLIATFFRPFPWEITSFIVLFSSLEAVMFLLLLVFVLYKAGVGKFLKTIFDSPILILSFSFAVVFAAAVGISTTNFGSLSRYKIPCLPFYLMFVLGAFYRLQIKYPKWVNWVLRKVG